MHVALIIGMCLVAPAFTSNNDQACGRTAKWNTKQAFTSLEAQEHDDIDFQETN